MPPVNLHAARAWTGATIAVVAAVLTWRLVAPALGVGQDGPSVTAPHAATEGTAAGSAPLARLARQVRLGQEALRQRHEQLDRLSSRSAQVAARIATLDAMLADGRLTESPGFLEKESSVRALQGILREAAAETPRTDADRQRLHMTADIARERLGQKLGALRGEAAAEAARAAEEAEALRDDIRRRTCEIEDLQARLLRELGP